MTFSLALLLFGAAGHQSRSSPAANKFIVECRFIQGFFRGNGYRYLISNDLQHVRLLASLEIGGGGEAIIRENVDLVVISAGNQLITFADPRLHATEGTLYLERLNLETMTSTTLTIENINSTKPSLERDPSNCKRFNA